MRVVASLTTLPDRYEKVVRTLTSLEEQTRRPDAIYLTVPTFARRLQRAYPEIPAEIRARCEVVNIESDYGPITKIIGGVLSEVEPDTIIISFDDDMVYPATMIEWLLSKAEQFPTAAIGSSGMLLRQPCPLCAITPNEENWIYRIPKFHVPDDGRRVDSIYGYPGALYRRWMFPINEELNDLLQYPEQSEALFMNDDIVISGYLSLRSVERRIFAGAPRVDFVRNNGVRERSEYEISYNLDKFFQRLNSSISEAKQLGMYTVTEPVDISETVLGVSTIVVFAVILLLLGIWCLWTML